ncbi:hypothetical protein TPHA_0I03320 [Tetrapisispora phaffii CBS 4417]|uniref:Major facilitator superfamily (MFS) profile domain-containing protein n=1 Tax=Tetrapisispora phaffii (strain ATCC 24235 / CBS 4417 / NBRC 1672 / NRRL Y-8282 / UCD 70-5) TaxID=1071381 RepID=G8BY56_TETPH|nr:hypothetical protein TPHA_0I03320 [Tetrapisispora phaffii CBS 4417]CCE64834.1 hypothetical protein TPHA_0I03320 [Tetrapisispora phaffii CBS 4417]
MYVESFKNTFAVDILEYFNLAKIEEAIPDISSIKPMLNSSDNSIETEKENDVQESFQVSSDFDSLDNKEKAVNDIEACPIEEKPKNQKKVEERDPYMLEWDDPNDPDFPVNWSKKKRAVILLQIMLLTSVTYMGSSIYTPGQLQIQSEFGVGHVVATLNLSLYVLGYGLGPLIFSPQSEFSLLGRQHLYTVTLFIFAMLQIGCATVHNFGGLAVLRFFSGVFCSPSLSTGGASIADILAPEVVPVFLGLWAVAAFSSPVLAPLLGAVMVVAEDWRWIFWLQLWLSTFTLIVLLLFMPETHHGNILYRRARRLRKQTGDDRWSTASAEKEKKLELGAFLLTAVYKPIKIIMREPIIAAIDMYTALLYGIFYLFFEAFPLVFGGIYNFTLVESGLAFLGFQVGCAIIYPIYIVFLVKYILPRMQNQTFVPEDFLVINMIVAIFLPAALFVFGWTAGVHWILPIFAEVLFVISAFTIFQSNFAYIAISFSDHVASVFAGNGLARAGFACAFPLFGQAMYNNLGSEKYPVAWGSSLLGFISIGMSTIPFLLYKYGAVLRSKSKFTA